MTNSEKQTKRGASRGNKPDSGPGNSGPGNSGPGNSGPGDAGDDFWAKNPGLVVGIALLLVGCAFILHISRWHFTTPVFVLCMGWAGVLATARFSWWAGIAMASDPGEERDHFDVSVSRHRELLEEKKVLLRAIKEIEFDRDLGKMSPEDAKQIMRYYRARAIDVIKEIDGQHDAELTVSQRIERDLQARISLESKGAPKKTAPKKTAPKKTAPKKGAPKKTAPKKTTMTSNKKSPPSKGEQECAAGKAEAGKAEAGKAEAVADHDSSVESA